LKNLDKALLKY